MDGWEMPREKWQLSASATRKDVSWRKWMVMVGRGNKDANTGKNISSCSCLISFSSSFFFHHPCIFGMVLHQSSQREFCVFTRAWTESLSASCFPSVSFLFLPSAFLCVWLLIHSSARREKKTSLLTLAWWGVPAAPRLPKAQHWSCESTLRHITESQNF